MIKAKLKLKQLFRKPLMKIMFPMVAMGIFLFVLGTFFFNREQPIEVLKENKWFEITIPSLIKNPERKLFKYKRRKLSYDENNCIKRTEYAHEFARVFDYDTNNDDYKLPQILIIGAHTAIGEAMVRKYRKKGVPFTAIKGIYDVDFSFRNQAAIEYLFKPMSFVGALIVDQPPLYRHASVISTNETEAVLHQYFKGMTRFLEKNNISFVVALPRPVSSFVLEKTLKRGGCYVDVPYVVDSDAIYDLDHPIMRAMRECELLHETTVELVGTEYVQSYTADQAAKFIRKQMKTKRTGHYSIYGHTNMTVKEAIDLLVSKKCKVTYKESVNKFDPVPLSAQTAMVGNETAKVDEMLVQSFKNFQNEFDKKPYVSIVVVGRNDNFSKNFNERAQNFINQVEDDFKKVPLASFEIVFVDYARNPRKQPLREFFTIPKYLKNRFRFIEVPLSFQMHLETELNTTVPFLEYIAKNIGIRRSRGEFVLTTNPDDLLPPELFEQIAKRQFNKGFLYRALRYDLRSGWEENYTLADIQDAFGSMTSLHKLSVKPRCSCSTFFNFIVSDDTFQRNANLCGSGDFIMLSKELWEAVNGFNEYPANPNIDATFSAKLMRLLPGYYRHFFRIPVLHQYHPKKNVFRKALPDHEKVMESYICTGTAPMIDDYPDTPSWGYANETFSEYRR